MTSTETNVTSAEYQELAEWLRTRAKHQTTMQRMADICSRIGSIDAAVADGEKRLKAQRDEEAGVKRDIEIARGKFERTNRDADDLLEKAKTEAASIVAKGKADAKAEVAKVDCELRAKRAQLAEASRRLADAQKLLAAS
jgi:hypothetical protein